MENFEKIVHVTPAFGLKEYGIGGCAITFILKGQKGAIQFKIGTDWHLPHIQRSRREWQHNFDSRFDKIHPSGYDIGYHSYKPHYEGQSSLDCATLEGGKCYYDGSSLQAEEMIPQFLAGGTDWLWPELERRYKELFDE